MPEVRTLTVIIQNQPLGSTPQQISDLLWEQVGLYANPNTIKTLDHACSTQAFVTFTDEDLIEFLNRNFEQRILDGQTQPVKFQIKLSKDEYTRLKVLSVTFDLPSGSGEVNRHGIRKLL